MSKKIIMGSDRLAVSLKEAIKEHLINTHGYEVVDVGMHPDGEFIPFYDIPSRVCIPIQKQAFDKGIVLCGSGAGVSMVANKHRGIYAVLCQSAYEARMCRIVNNANVLALGGNLTTPAMALDIVDAFINTEFAQDLPQDRKEFMETAYANVQSIEQKNFK